MKLKNIIWLLLPTFMTWISCDDVRSYTELLRDEEKAINSFLAFQHVITTIPADTVFQEGPNAPYYQLDEEGNVYMQVLKSGDRKNNKAEDGQTIYFRYGRINLIRYSQGAEDTPEGNYGDISDMSCYFKFYSYQSSSSYDYGYGLQLPLSYLGIDCEVNLVIKSQWGPNSEISNVIPYLYNVRYFPSKN